VLADLSLENPNVFYELGIRHVMTNSGTVLMCRRGAVLPFDVQLSRVIFYDYDGQSLDWEEVERVVERLQLALQQAQRNEPDSPVHALLETVFRASNLPASEKSWVSNRRERDDSLSKYQRLVASYWRRDNEELGKLYKEHRDTVFGARALGYYCLDEDPSPELATQVAAHLSDAEQYALANQLFGKLQNEGRLDYPDLLRYSTSYSEEHPGLNGADQALTLVRQAREMVEQRFGGMDAHTNPEAAADLAWCYQRFAGLREWRWQLTRHESDLEAAVEDFGAALQHMERARSLGEYSQPGLIAQTHMKLMILLRMRDADSERADMESHRDAILNLKPRPSDSPVGVSYLKWYQAIALADSGTGDASRKMALTAFTEDARIMNNPNHWEVGRRQYVHLRRFLERYSNVLRHPSLLGVISQILQSGRA
jgi:hypothetical protein